MSWIVNGTNIQRHYLGTRGKRDRKGSKWIKTGAPDQPALIQSVCAAYANKGYFDDTVKQYFGTQRVLRGPDGKFVSPNSLEEAIISEIDKRPGLKGNNSNSIRPVDGRGRISERKIVYY